MHVIYLRVVAAIGPHCHGVIVEALLVEILESQYIVT
jgi:hypothetical protein